MLHSLKLGFTDDAVLESELALLTVLDEQIGLIESKIAAVAVNDERVKFLMTMLGLGYFAASLLVAEICDINRFGSDKRLVWLLASASLVIGLSLVGSRGRGIGLFVGLWFRLLRLQGCMMKGSGNFTTGMLGGGVVRRLLLLLLMRCFALSISC